MKPPLSNAALVDYDPNDRAANLLAGVEFGFALTVLDSSPDCIKLVELDGRLSYMNRNGLCAMEIDDFSSVDQQPWPSLWPQDTEARLAEALQRAGAGETTQFEAFCPTAKGRPRWWHVTVAPVRNRQGGIERVLVVSRDVSAMVENRKALEDQAGRLACEVAKKDAALERQKVLLGEIDHRVKNSFASVIGLLRIQARSHRGEPAETALSDAANRISTLARVHEQLHLDPGSGLIPLQDYLSGLATDICGALGAEVTLTRMPADAIRVHPGDAAAIGQILAEFLGNAVKHARRDGTGPKIDMSLVAEDATEAGQRLRLRVEDDGPGLPERFDPEAGTGLGMQICTIYSSQFGGRLNFGSSARGGAMFEVELVLTGA
ncbi:MAG: sensor histidine kinase [Paracoccus sp. (in: a-proteobacteria)]|uniref:sensor histidine kinase n=1 Tax=Paracoccus sp. TaxID=267 RepID=UPI00391B566B